MLQENPIKQLATLGQSVWLDYIRRDLMESGELRRLIEIDGIRGMTSNPAIFGKAIVGSTGYTAEITSMADRGMDALAIYEAISQHDVQMAADVFRPLYTSSDGSEGYVSLEVNPHLSHNTEGTIKEARRLWNTLDRPNILIKIPATSEGLPAIQQLISEGINVNITLLFGLPRYRQVVEAYVRGIEARLAQGKTVNKVASVASFFVSRIDTLVDSLLDEWSQQESGDKQLVEQLEGQIAIASAQMAYQIFKEVFNGERFSILMQLGARPQRLLWASTGTKHKKYSDVKYIEALIGPDTITTVPPETLNAYRDHGDPKNRLEHTIQPPVWFLSQLMAAGIDIGTLTKQLEDEGIEKFSVPFDDLITTISETSIPHMSTDTLKMVSQEV